MVLINKLNKELWGYSDMLSYADDVYQQVQAQIGGEINLVVQDFLSAPDLIHFKIVKDVDENPLIHLIFYPSGFSLRFEEALKYKAALIGRIIKSIDIFKRKSRVLLFLEYNIGKTFSSPREKLSKGQSLMKFTITGLNDSRQEVRIKLESGTVLTLEDWQFNYVLTNLDEIDFVPIVTLENLLQEKLAATKIVPHLADLLVLAGVAKLSLIESDTGREVQGIKLTQLGRISTIVQDPSEYEMGKEMWLCPGCYVNYPPFFQPYVDSYGNCVICDTPQDRLVRRKIRDYDPKGESLSPFFNVPPFEDQRRGFLSYLNEILEMPFMEQFLAQMNLTNETKKYIFQATILEKIRATHKMFVSEREN